MSVSAGGGIVGLSPCGRSGPALLGLMLVVVTQRAVCAVGAQGLVGRGCSTALGRACWWPWGGSLLLWSELREGCVSVTRIAELPQRGAAEVSLCRRRGVYEVGCCVVAV